MASAHGVEPIVIVDYGAGNLRSIQNMLRRLGRDSEITSDPGVVARASKLILPGVGKFDFGMRQLEERGLKSALDKRVLGDGAPLLGICLGAQLLTRGSEEGDLPGLGWIAARTVRFDPAKAAPATIRIPHMGWADTAFVGDHPIAAGLEKPRFYYVHSYHIEPEDETDVLARAEHGYAFVAGVARGNVLGVQFHPEKSHRFGMTLLNNFATRY
jgi:imidazole glycerol-phosphate synthase subunit HisH